MKITFYRGNFNGDTGLVCLCHVQLGDGDKINKVVLAISKLRDNTKEKVINVPFAHLENDPKKKMDYVAARDVLRKISANLPNAIFCHYSKCQPFSIFALPCARFGSIEL